MALPAAVFCAAAAAGLLYLAVGLVFYRIAVARTGKKGFLSGDPSLPDSVRGADAEALAWWEAAPKEEIRIRSFDGLELVADYFPAPRPAAAVAVLAHGYTAAGPSMRRYARLFQERLGCSLIVPDLRGHGRSEGGYIGFGLHDARDLRSWIGAALEREGKEARIVLFGVSMGAASALIACGGGLPANVACAVSDCAYSDAREELAFKLRRLYGLPRFPALNAVETVTRFLAGYRLSDASPRAAAARSSVPVLFIHGDADGFVPAGMARELYAAAAAEKELFIVPEAGHAESFHTAGEAYAERVANFVNRFLRPAHPSASRSVR